MSFTGTLVDYGQSFGKKGRKALNSNQGIISHKTVCVHMKHTLSCSSAAAGDIMSCYSKRGEGTRAGQREST